MDGTALNKKYKLTERVEALEEGGGGGYVLPVATDEVLGGVKIGAGLSITEEGVLSANVTPYTPPAYSTSEVNTGAKWIDGKDIYRKVVVYDSAIPVGNNTISVANLETFINGYGSVSSNGGTSGVVMPYEASSTQNKLAISSYGAGEVVFSVGTAYQSQYAMNHAVIVIEYTKSTVTKKKK